MPLNLTPEYFEADRQYRAARTPDEKLAALEQMLRAIPKHKGSEKKQADLKRRISELKEARQHRKKGGGGADPYHVVPQGAGQAVLFGLLNCGKSSIVGRLTKAPVKITDFPYGTPVPVPGMASHEDVPIELVDMPPVTPEHVVGGMVNALRNTDIILVVADLTSTSVLEDIEALLAILTEREIVSLEADPAGQADGEEQMSVGAPVLIACTKADLPGAADTFQTLRELRGERPEMIMTSAHTGAGLDTMMRRLFETLDVIRVYAKEPGKPADLSRPFILPAGSTVAELARTIHKDIAANLKYARIWGEHAYDGQQVHAHYVLHDRDKVELHA